MDKATTHVCAFDMSGWAMWHARYISYIKKLLCETDMNLLNT